MAKLRRDKRGKEVKDIRVKKVLQDQENKYRIKRQERKGRKKGRKRE